MKLKNNEITIIKIAYLKLFSDQILKGVKITEMVVQ